LTKNNETAVSSSWRPLAKIDGAVEWSRHDTIVPMLNFEICKVGGAPVAGDSSRTQPGASYSILAHSLPSISLAAVLLQPHQVAHFWVKMKPISLSREMAFDFNGAISMRVMIMSVSDEAMIRKIRASDRNLKDFELFSAGVLPREGLGAVARVGDRSASVRTALDTSGTSGQKCGPLSWAWAEWLPLSVQGALSFGAIYCLLLSLFVLLDLNRFFYILKLF
jgi:hypothetical protein